MISRSDHWIVGLPEIHTTISEGGTRHRPLASSKLRYQELSPNQRPIAFVGGNTGKSLPLVYHPLGNSWLLLREFSWVSRPLVMAFQQMEPANPFLVRLSRKQKCSGLHLDLDSACPHQIRPPEQ